MEGVLYHSQQKLPVSLLGTITAIATLLDTHPTLPSTRVNPDRTSHPHAPIRDVRRDT